MENEKLVSHDDVAKWFDHIAKAETALMEDELIMDNCWKDNRNWKARIFYHAPNDPRKLVPKHGGGGWTNNFSFNSAAGKELKVKYDEHQNHLKVAMEELKKLQVNPTCYVPPNPEQQQAFLQNCLQQRQQVDMFLASLVADDRNYQAGLYRCPDDYRSHVPARDGSGKTVRNWWLGKTLGADRMEAKVGQLDRTIQALHTQLAKIATIATVLPPGTAKQE